MARPKKGEAKKPKAGDNTPLSEDELRCLLFGHKAKVEACDRAVAEAKAVLVQKKAERKAALALAKKEYGPNAEADIAELQLLEQPKGPEALKIDIERRLRLARWNNIAVGTQFTFDDFEATPAVDYAREEGKIAGLKGAPKKPPYDPSLPQFKAWMEGYDEGQAIALSDFRDKLKPLDDSGGKRKPRQMDLKERNDLGDADADMVMADVPRVDTSDAPFAPPADMPAQPSQPQ